MAASSKRDESGDAEVSDTTLKAALGGGLALWLVGTLVIVALIVVLIIAMA